jgi:MshEN domain
MTNAEIPRQTLSEAHQAIAERRGSNAAALDRESIGESEWTAALAYVLGIPLVETEDLNDAFLGECRALTAELETEALMDYQFVPLSRRGDTLIAISSCPWDATTTEVLLGYFQQCARVKFALASPACVRALLERLKAAEPKPTPARSPTQSATPPAPVVLPPGARGTKNPDAPKPPAPPAPRSASPQNDDAWLTSEDVTRLMNVLAAEIHRLAQQKSPRSL